MLRILRGVCSKLNVKIPLLAIFSVYGRRALLRHSYTQYIKLQHKQPRLQTSPARRHKNALEQELADMLRQKLEARELRGGIQVCVYRSGDGDEAGEVVAQVCAGSIGWADARPVTHQTLFPALGLSSLLAAWTVHRMHHTDGTLKYDDRIAKIWPNFATKTATTTANNNDKESTVTATNVKPEPAASERKSQLIVRDVLCHTAGLAHVLSPQLTMKLKNLCNWFVRTLSYYNRSLFTTLLWFESYSNLTVHPT